jgi:capsular exopolysaccharide synthesis family protein
MSYILDALQRAETERAGTRVEGATELLKRAERDAAIQRRSGRAGRPAATSVPPTPSQRLIVESPEEHPADVAVAAPAQEPAEGIDNPVPGLTDGFGTLGSSLPLESHLVAITGKETPAAEAFRLLGVRLRNLRRERPLQKLLITSTVPSEGKSMISVNLASTLASESHKPVLLLEGDVRRPTLLQLFKVPPTTGLCDWLQGKCDFSECIWRLQGTGFYILPSGSMPEDPLNLIQSPRLHELMDQLAERFHWIVIDSPPVLPLADTSVWARAADGILLVTRHNVTRRQYLQRGLQALDSEKLIGAVMNSAAINTDSYYYYGHTPSKNHDED